MDLSSFFNKVTFKDSPSRLVNLSIAFAIIILLILIIVKFSSGFEGLYDPTQSVTMYHRTDCNACRSVMPEWEVFVENMKTDGNIFTRTVDCSNPANLGECAYITRVPTVIKRQTSGRQHMFKGSHTVAGYYNFATTEY